MNVLEQVEESLRSQRGYWQEITERVSRTLVRDMPPEQPKRILIFGVGSSYFAARLSACAWFRDRTRPRLPVVACSSMQIPTEVFPQKGDWAFALSHRGATPATLKALEACDREGAYTVLVCGQEVADSPHARVMLRTCPLEKVEPHTTSVTSAICAITSLLLGVKAGEEWDALRSIGDPDLELMRRRAGGGPTVMIGEWEGEWIAREGALKIMEMAGVPVRAYGSEEFFHGPKMAFAKNDVLWHVSHPRDHRVGEMKAQHEISVPGSSILAFIPSLVEAQWLALATALNRLKA